MTSKFIFTLFFCGCLCSRGVSSEGLIIHLDQTGNGYVFWESNGDNPAIKMAEYSAVKAKWKPAVTLSNEDMPSFQPEAVILSQRTEEETTHDILVAWKSIDASLGIVSLYASTLKSGQQWSSPHRVSSIDESVSRFALAARANCGATLAWTSMVIGTAGTVTRNSLSSDYSVWVDPVTISDHTE